MPIRIAILDPMQSIRGEEQCRSSAPSRPSIRGFFRRHELGRGSASGNGRPLRFSSTGPSIPTVKIIITGATGMVGEGVMLECLANPAVERVLAVSRRPSGHSHPKLEECLVKDFRELGSVEARLAGYDACFYCAGVSSVGKSEAEYTAATYDTPLAFATTLARLNPRLVLVHISGASTDSSEQGPVMWARVKGKAENALSRLPVRAVYNFRPGLMKPVAGQKNLKRVYRVLLVFYPVMKLFLSALSLHEVGRAMIRCVQSGAPKSVLEVADIRALGAS
jgi:uncharacterized protein YbjT (DUF2867 family)